MDMNRLSGHRFAGRQWSFDTARAAALADALGFPYVAGHVPPTLAFSADLDNRLVDQLFALTGLGPHQLLHGEQHFHYHLPLIAGVVYRVSGILQEVEKKPRFHLLHTKTRLFDALEQLVCEMHSVYVAIAQPSGPAAGPTLDLTGGTCWPGPTFSRERIAAFAAASGDDNPVHLEPAIAHQAGHPDVFAQGMLGMGLLGMRIPAGRLQRFGVRFLSPIPVNEMPLLHCLDAPSITMAMTGNGGEGRIRGYADVAR